MITRRCTQRQFLLRPDKETNNAYTYCLGDAARRFRVDVLFSQQMSNHHHTIIYDRDGSINEFTEHFHKMLAKCQNALRGRWENMWASEPPCNVELVGVEDVLEKLVYAATNPVKDGLVEKVHHWPGVKALTALVKDVPLRAYRPWHFFREDGPMPAVVELRLTIPAELSERDTFVRLLCERVAAAETAFARARCEKGYRVLGRARVLRQSWRDCPASNEPRRVLRPRVAARSAWARIEALQRSQEFLDAYRRAYNALRAGAPIPFPYGTYWMRRFANVSVDPVPSSN